MSSAELEFQQNFCTENVKKSTKISSSGKLLIGLTGGVAVGLSIICLPFVTPALRKYCLPYVPATNNQINNIFKLLRTIKKNEKLLDIGSGDGRIVIAAAKNGLKADGVELNTWLVQYSRLASLYHGVFSQTKFFQKDLWKFNVSSYNYIVIFGVEQMMNDLEKKLIKEAYNESQVIACRFPLPNLVANQIIGDGIDTVWLYKMNSLKTKSPKT